MSEGDVFVQLSGVETRSAIGNVGAVANEPLADGGRKYSTTTQTGNRSVAASGPEGVATKYIGRADQKYVRERRVERCVAAWLIRRGHTVDVAGIAKEDHSHDQRGADGVLTVDSDPVELQVVTIPADGDLWRDAAQQGHAEQSRTWDEWVRCVSEAIEGKRAKYPPEVRQAMLLALDAEHVGPLIASPEVLAEISRNYESSPGGRFWAVLIVGPTENDVAPIGEQPTVAPRA